jgi:hypothetical protein
MMDNKEIVKEVLIRALSFATKTGEFIVEQAPDLVQQLLQFKAVTALFSCILFLIIAATGIVSLVVLVKKAINGDDDGYMAVLFFYGVFSALVGSIAFFQSLHDLILIQVAPKIYLIEYASKLLK